MKTIEERAKLRSEYYDEDDGYSEGIYVGYIDGATEQKDIDIDKACEIVRKIANEYFGDWEQSCKVEDTFRKAMEEQYENVDSKNAQQCVKHLH